MDAESPLYKGGYLLRDRDGKYSQSVAVDVQAISMVLIADILFVQQQECVSCSVVPLLPYPNQKLAAAPIADLQAALTTVAVAVLNL